MSTPWYELGDNPDIAITPTEYHARPVERPAPPPLPGTAEHGHEAPEAEADWRESAACKGLTDLFYPTRGGQVTEAKAVCAGCPVKDVCLETALADGERFGIWGGTTEKERRQLRRERNPRPVGLLPCGTKAAYLRHLRDRERPCEACAQANRDDVAERRRRKREAA